VAGALAKRGCGCLVRLADNRQWLCGDPPDCSLFSLGFIFNCMFLKDLLFIFSLAWGLR
jgi:hypothetical protein